MEERLAAARRDQTMGRVSVPKELDKFSQEISFDELKKLASDIFNSRIKLEAETKFIKELLARI